MIRYAIESDKPWLKKLFNKYEKELNANFETEWFKYQHNTQNIFIVDEENKGFCNYEVRQDNSVFIREIACEITEKGTGSKFIEYLKKYNGIMVATYKDSKANKFYRKQGFYLFGEVLDQGQKEMNVYVLEVPQV